MNKNIHNIEANKIPACYYENFMGAYSAKENGMYECDEGHGAYYIVRARQIQGVIFASQSQVALEGLSQRTMDRHGEDQQHKAAS